MTHRDDLIGTGLGIAFALSVLLIAGSLVAYAVGELSVWVRGLAFIGGVFFILIVFAVLVTHGSTILNRVDSYSFVVFAVTLALAGYVGFQVVGAATSDDMQAYMEQSEDWCEERNGTLVNVNAVWGGGLHCDLPNGSTVHMKNVIEVNENALEDA